jgi:Na+-transporting NADH:ubiquinone oxidoreductase subunit B
MSGLRGILAARLAGSSRTDGAPHVRDALHLGRVMTVVSVALAPCVAMALWNTGRQANLALAALGRASAGGWRGAVLDAFGIGLVPDSVLACVIHGALWFVPCWLVALGAGLLCELAFARARQRPLQEGVGVTALMFALTLPPAVPLWQVALGMGFGIVVAKELFGGTGRNFVNPALAARAFVYFGYPGAHSGNAVWVAVDGYTSATPLTALNTASVSTGMGAVSQTWTDAFLGTMPGCMGETSALACLLGAAVLVLTGIASWRVMGGMLAGGLLTAWFFGRVGHETNAMFLLPPHWHLVVGGFAFGMVFMATDPVTSAQTNPGRWVYGFLVGLFCVLIRVLNPGFPESVMIVILLGNVFAPLIDWFVIAAHGPLRRWRLRRRRHAAA